jgi:hypothetical protein
VLDEYRAREDDDEGRRRVQLAVLKLLGSHGDLTRLRELVLEAADDFRDVLCRAEYSRQIGRWGMPEEERQQVIAQDREEYVAWLLSHEKPGDQ